MPAFERSPAPQGPVVRGLSGRGFTIDGETYAAAFLTPEGAAAWPDAPGLDALTAAHVETVLAIEPQPEFLILGTGATQGFPPRAFVRALEERGIGVEAMDSRAAARTWGVLRAEERWIVAALLPL